MKTCKQMELTGVQMSAHDKGLASEAKAFLQAAAWG